MQGHQQLKNKFSQNAFCFSQNENRFCRPLAMSLNDFCLWYFFWGSEGLSHENCWGPQTW